MRFYKFQALGNDFLIVREAALRAVTSDFESFAQQICDRHFGAGGDGFEVLLDRTSINEADFEVRLFNADGGETSISGNGTRCVAAYLYLVEDLDKPSVRIATGAGVKRLKPVQKLPHGFIFETEMGMPQFRNDEIPVNLSSPLDRVISQPLEVNGQTVKITATSIGNPHCSIFVEDFTQFDWRSLGAQIETHPAFPERTNVEFIRVASPNEIEVRFWERGCGETLASGTGACGAALAAMLNGFTGREVKVITAAGLLRVEWREDGSIVQTGETSLVYQGDWLAR